MSVVNGYKYNSCSSKFPCSPALNSLESSLQLSLSSLKELLLEFEQLYISSENYKTQFIEQKGKCERNCCKSSEALKEIITAKDKVIQLTASALTKLNETKNLEIIKEIFKILCGDTTQQTPTKPVEIKKEPESPVYSPDKDLIPVNHDVHMKEESLLEIEGTPTGRTSPIIQPKKLRNGITNSCSDFRDKKKCPSSWPTSETKAIKLVFPTSTPTQTKGKNLRLKQTKFQVMKMKPSNSIDLTNSPDFAGGIRGARSDSLVGVQPLIKKESIESEDTILPSPTSGPTHFSALYKSTTKNSPNKFKPPLLMKSENPIENKCGEKKIEGSINENKCGEKKCSDLTNIEESINLLQPKRKNGLKMQSPVKLLFVDKDKDMTNCETQKDESISLLHHVNMLEEAHQENIGRKTPRKSPSKRPLVENQNIVNLPEEDIHIEASMSLLRREVKTEDNGKRRVPYPMEPIYKEPTVRKKAEKLALPGWSCDECENFYAELYKDNPEMLSKKMNECSKHRGRHNPARPPTPGGFWEPRWDVPSDTDEFNRRNNAV